MEPYINEYQVTEKLYIQWILEAKKEGTRLAFAIFWCLMTIFCIGYAIWAESSFFGLLAFYCAFRALPRDLVFAKKMYRRLCTSQGSNSWKRTITVSCNEIVVQDDHTVTTFQTDDVVKVDQDAAKLRVFLRGGNSLRLYKDAFTAGTWQECLERLSK